MARPRRSSTRTPAPEPSTPPETELDLDLDLDLDDALLGDPRLSAADRRFLGRVSRFLLNIPEHRYLRRAVRAGYSEAEHEAFWVAFDLAAGRRQRIPNTFLDSMDPDRKAMLEEVDQFENLWFPRLHAIIQRYAPESSAAAFESEFFRDLNQQPLGPGVLDSVSKLLDRFEALEHSSWPGAAEVIATARSRGLTAPRIEKIRRTIADLRERGALGTATHDEVERAKAFQEQTQGIAQLQKIWNDWATTLRPVFNTVEQLQLGLTVRRTARTRDDDELDTLEDDIDDDDAPLQESGEPAPSPSVATP